MRPHSQAENKTLHSLHGSVLENNMILQIINNTKVVSLKTGTAGLFTKNISLMYASNYTQDW